jgi:polyhydroxyalkanoate synthesis repressor PhaR
MVIIKRYPNRKLYNTEAKQYITLDGIGGLIRQGTEIQVIDHATGEDLTALTLTQIILEQEKKQSGLLSNSFLTGLIRAGEESLTALQRSLHSSISFWHQIDEEIKQRIQALVRQGELTDSEGKKLVEKLLKQGSRLREEYYPSNKDDISSMSDQDLETYLKQRQIPTQQDLKNLYQQLDELAAKLDEFDESKS